MDELLAMNPEPCDTCKAGLMYFFVCFDGKRRCVDCVDKMAKRRGWDKLPGKPPAAVIVDAPPVPKRRKKQSPDNMDFGL